MDMWPFSMFDIQSDIILKSVFNVDKKIVKNYQRAVSLDSNFFSQFDANAFPWIFEVVIFEPRGGGAGLKKPQYSYKSPIKIFIHLSIKEILGSILEKKIPEAPP